MTLNHACWLATLAYGLHVLEEFAFNWRGWVRSVTGIQVGWTAFWTGNGLVVALGAVCAEAARSSPSLALAYPALMLVNVTFFHLAPFVWMRGRFPPGLITGLTLFYPIGFWCYRCAHNAGVLSQAAVVNSILLGAAVMMVPLVAFLGCSLGSSRE